MDGFSTDPKKKLVSYDQMVALLDFLKDHPELANGKTRGRRGKLHTVRIWHQCAKKVNVIKDGAYKDGRGWAKYWCDWKYRVRRKALELRACKESNRTPPEGASNLTSLEETLLNIIGDNAVDNIVIKNDPLADKESADEEPGHESNEDINIHYNDAAINRKSMKNLIRKRKSSSPDISDEYGSGPSSPVERKPRLSATNGEPDLDDAREFIRIEKMRLERDEQKLKSLQCIVTQITRIADIMSSIKDVLKDSKV